MKLRAVPITTLGFVTLISGAALVSGTAWADPREDVLEAMGKCAALTDDKARLGCYDGVAPRLRDALNTPPQTLSRPPTLEQEKSWFGFDLGGLFGSDGAKQTTPEQFGQERTADTQGKTEAAKEELPGISAGVTDYSFTLTKRFIVFLDNGQVWRQIPGDAELARFKKTAGDNKVSITRGMFGSYNMTLNDSEKVYKVSRVK